MIRPVGYSNSIQCKAQQLQAAPVNVAAETSAAKAATVDGGGKKHLSYWRSLGISSLFGVSALGSATLFCKTWRVPAAFGLAIAGLSMLFDLPDTLFIGRK